MEVKIGVTQASRELVLDSNENADAFHKAVSEALENENGLLVLTDTKGRTVFVPAAKLAYVEIVGETGRRVGFASA